MRNVTLLQLNVENFKGIKTQYFTLGGSNATIEAANGVGKTTLNDAYLWCLFGKDSSGRKDFAVRPLDRDNKRIPGVEVRVEVIFDVDGTKHHLVKIEQEKVDKRGQVSYPKLHTYNEVPMLEKEYKALVNALIPELTFHCLTDLTYVLSGLHWQERRALLCEMAGDRGTPEGFDKLIAKLAGREIADYKKVLNERKKAYVTERDAIPPRIDELARGMQTYADSEVKTELQVKREKVVEVATRLSKEKAEIFTSETARLKEIDKINGLKGKLKEREFALQSDMSGTEALQAESSTMAEAFLKQSKAYDAVLLDKDKQQGAVSRVENIILDTQANLARIRSQLKSCREHEEATTCYACGQNMPAEVGEEAAKKKEADIEKCLLRSKNLNTALAKETASLKEEQEKLELLITAADTAEDELLAKEKANKIREDEISEAIANRTKPDRNDDDEWLKFDMRIKTLEAGLCTSAAEQLATLEKRWQAAQDDLRDLDKALAQADRNKQDSERTTELKGRERELSQSIAEVDAELDEIVKYKLEDNRLLALAVNGKFKHVRFKLFNTLLNGEVEECCDAIYRGVPHPDMSTGQKILAGVDVVNALGEHYGVRVPLFIDHSESVTLELGCQSQVIALKAVKGVKRLEVAAG